MTACRISYRVIIDNTPLTPGGFPANRTEPILEPLWDLSEPCCDGMKQLMQANDGESVTVSIEEDENGRPEVHIEFEADSGCIGKSVTPVNYCPFCGASIQAVCVDRLRKVEKRVKVQKVAYEYITELVPLR